MEGRSRNKDYMMRKETGVFIGKTSDKFILKWLENLFQTLRHKLLYTLY